MIERTEERSRAHECFALPSDTRVLDTILRRGLAQTFKRIEDMKASAIVRRIRFAQRMAKHEAAQPLERTALGDGTLHRLDESQELDRVVLLLDALGLAVRGSGNFQAPGPQRVVASVGLVHHVLRVALAAADAADFEACGPCHGAQGLAKSADHLFPRLNI